MESTTVRIRKDTRDLLRELSAQSGAPMQEVLAKALEAYRRQRILVETNRAYAALRKDPKAWKELQEERREWDSTLLDGLENN